MNVNSVPSIEYLKKQIATVLSQTVEMFLETGTRHASAKEISDRISIANKSETQSVYASLDPYTRGAEKNDPNKADYFERDSGNFRFLGYGG